MADHYETETESWMRIEGEGEDCWLESGMLDAPAQEDSTRSNDDPTGNRDAKTGNRIEFDIPASDAGSATVQALIEGGLLKIFDPSENVVGAALEVFPEDDKASALLGGYYGRGGEILDGQIAVMVGILSKERPGDETLKLLLRRIERADEEAVDEEAAADEADDDEPGDPLLDDDSDTDDPD